MYTQERWYLGTIVQLTLDMDRSGDGTKNSQPTLRSVTLWSKIVRYGEDGVGMDFVLTQQKRRESFEQFLKSVH
jgi:hypothetical protein